MKIYATYMRCDETFLLWAGNPHLFSLFGLKLGEQPRTEHFSVQFIVTNHEEIHPDKLGIWSNHGFYSMKTRGSFLCKEEKSDETSRGFVLKRHLTLSKTLPGFHAFQLHNQLKIPKFQRISCLLMVLPFKIGLLPENILHTFKQKSTNNLHPRHSSLCYTNI